jgi:hypothetical protein
MQYVVLAAALFSLAVFLKVQYGRPRTTTEAKLAADEDERV